jgi:hypothetical protein
MKTLKAYLSNQKDIAAAAYYTVLKEGGNLHDAKFWLERIIHIELMLNDLNNGEKTKKN